MDSEELAHLKEVLRSYKRRLWVLEGKEALQGLQTPPDVLIEIEDLREKIVHHQSRIEAFPQQHRMFPEPGPSHPTTSSHTARKQIEITFNGSFEQLTPEIESALVRAIAAMADISPDEVAVLRVMSGSVIFVVELPEKAATALVQLYDSGDETIEELGIQNIQLTSEPYPALSTFDPQVTIADGPDFLSSVDRLLQNNKERAVVYGLFVRNLELSEIYRADRNLFVSVEDVQITKERLQLRLSGFPVLSDRLRKV